MKQSIQLRLGQHLTMTPQLQQAIRLLQLSTMELQAEVQQVLESNIMLEPADEDSDVAVESNGGETPGVEEESKYPSEEPASFDDFDAGAQDIPDELPVDSAWEEIYDSPGVMAAPGGAALNGSEFEDHRTAEETLQAHLLWQINLAQMSDTDRVIAMAIIDAIDDAGYLQASLEDIHASLGGEDLDVELDEIQAVLHLIQHLDPPGVGARDLRECLLLQINQLRPDTPWLDQARSLLAEHMDLLAGRDFAQLMRRMKLAREELQQVVALIQSLNPRPGGQIADTPVQYVVPDVFVRKTKGAWMVELNSDAIPHLRINPRYAAMVRRADNSSDNNSLKSHLQEARWFIKSLQSRSETLLKVATAIVERQRAFLEHGEEAMKPLVLHDIAEALGMHESTISRVTTRKYMHTPRGIFELKYFFSSHVSTAVGGECSSTAIRAFIKKLIAAENAVKPLSDSKIASLLADQGINVARRTVAKYREALQIPPSNERKRLA